MERYVFDIKMFGQNVFISANQRGKMYAYIRKYVTILKSVSATIWRLFLKKEEHRVRARARSKSFQCRLPNGFETDKTPIETSEKWSSAHRNIHALGMYESPIYWPGPAAGPA